MSISPKIRELAKTHPIFTALSPSESELIFSCLDYIEGDSDQVIFREGDAGSKCFFLLEGSINVFKSLESGTEERLATLKVGSMFGHIALIDRKPRSATCCLGALGGKLLVLTTDDFERLFSAKKPFAYKVLDYIINDLSLRLRGATKQLSKARKTHSPTLRHSHSLKAAQLLAGLSYSTEELDQLEVMTTEFEQSARYSR